MKKSIYILVLILVFSACDKGFEELNVDPTRPVQVSLGSKLTAAQRFMSSERYDNWRANLIYQSTMMQHLSTTAGYWSGDKYTWNRGYASSLIDRYYGSAVKSVEDMLVQIDEEGAPEEMRSIVRIMRVYIYSRLTDLYGDIPYSEAGQAVISGILKPKYDPQSGIYADMLKELEESAAALGSGTSEFSAADLIYQGDQSKWKKVANSLMLRLGLRMIKVDPAAAEAWATKAIAGGVMKSNEDIFYLKHEAAENRNGNSEAFDADANPRLSETFVNFLQGDPRLTVLGSLPENTGEVDANDQPILRTTEERLDVDAQRGLPNGLDAPLLLEATGEENVADYTEPNRLLITAFDAPMFFQTYAEVEFMLAEAAVRWGLAGGEPGRHYFDGVTAAMKMLELYGPGGAIADADINAYLADNPFDEANALEQINTQYWAATFLNEYESFSNWRRTGFPELVPIVYSGNETGGTIPRRMTYSESEQADNAENYMEAIGRQGPDLLTTRVWWDVEQ